MNLWYFLTPKNILLFGKGNFIEGHIDNPDIIEKINAKAKKSFVANKGVEFSSFAFPFISAIAGLYYTPILENFPKFSNEPNDLRSTKDRRLPNRYAHAKPIKTIGQLIHFLTPVEGQNISAQKTAIDFYNSIIASKFSVYNHEKTIAQKIIDSFLSGNFLIYPKVKWLYF